MAGKGQSGLEYRSRCWLAGGCARAQGTSCSWLEVPPQLPFASSSELRILGKHLLVHLFIHSFFLSFLNPWTGLGNPIKCSHGTLYLLIIAWVSIINYSRTQQGLELCGIIARLETAVETRNTGLQGQKRDTTWGLDIG